MFDQPCVRCAVGDQFARLSFPDIVQEGTGEHEVAPPGRLRNNLDKPFRAFDAVLQKTTSALVMVVLACAGGNESQSNTHIAKNPVYETAHLRGVDFIDEPPQVGKGMPFRTLTPRQELDEFSGSSKSAQIGLTSRVSTTHRLLNQRMRPSIRTASSS